MYGPGFQGGYQYVARSGLTGLASIGTGFPGGAETGDRVAIMAGMGAGLHMAAVTLSPPISRNALGDTTRILR